MVNTAVILAAGLGTRFGKKTELMPKGFIEVSGISMIERSVKNLIDCGIERIIIGTGYKKEMYEDLTCRFSEIQCVYSEQFATTNSMWTLLNCREAIDGNDFLLLESDLVYEKRAISSLLSSKQKNIMLCSEVTKFQDSYFIEFDNKSFLTNCSTKKEEIKVCGELVGIHKISTSFFGQLCEFYNKVKGENPKMGYEFALLHISQIGEKLYVLKIPNLKWYEIDDVLDLEMAEKIFCKNMEHQ